MKDRQDVAAEILKRIEGVENPRVVEVGVEVGKLSRTLLAKRDDLKLFMVDSWKPFLEQPIEYIETGDPSSAKTIEEQVERKRQATEIASQHGYRAFIVDRDSVSAASTFLRESLDLVFLDADHSYEGVTTDLDAWLPKVRKGGWLGGHDYGNPSPQQDMSGVKRAVDEFLGYEPVLGKDWTWFARKAS